METTRKNHGKFYVNNLRNHRNDKTRKCWFVFENNPYLFFNIKDNKYT